MNTTDSSGKVRQHYLDALRAFAMLLGIALHAALSFAGTPWIVQDNLRNERYRWFFEAVHGFRMPMFMFLSGYFTMLLWRRRGLAATVDQRYQRIFIPCLIGLVTIIPMLRWASTWAAESASQRNAPRQPQSKLITAIRTNNLAQLDAYLNQGESANQADPETGIPALNWAVMMGDARAVRLLVDRGADVNGPDRSGYRPLHSAAFLGRVEIVELLLRRKADPSVRGPLNDKPADSTRADWRTTRGIIAALQLPVPDEQDLQQRRSQCRKLLDPTSEQEETAAVEAAKKPWIERLRSSYLEFLASSRFELRLRSGEQPVQLFFTSQFDHLWFLWFLCWLVGCFGLVVLLVQRIGLPRFPRRVLLSPLRWLWLLPLTMIPQLFMGIYFPSFGPDTSAGVFPLPHLLLYYGVFFGVGAFYYDCHDERGALSRWWVLQFALALGAYFLAAEVKDQLYLSGLAQVVYAWTMTFGMLGLFRFLLRGENRTVRYLSDSAYWLYVAHLPLVIIGQAWVRGWQQPTIVKFICVCVGVTAVLLLSYQLLVRNFWLGRLLNGSRERRHARDEAVSKPELVAVKD